MIAVLIPAHNEARRIGACLRSLREAALDPTLQGEAVEIFVALDRCTDATAEIAARWQAITVTTAAGVGVARAAAAEAALARGARWLANTDADTRVPAHWLAGQLHCGAEVFCGPVRVADWRGYCAATRRAFEGWEPAQDEHAHVHGANLGCSADAYRAVGGFQNLACGEDVALVRQLAAAGFVIARRGDPCVATSARRSARAVGGFSDFLAALEASVQAAPAE